MANKPYQDKGSSLWSMRVRRNGEDYFVSKGRSAADARRKMEALLAKIEGGGKPKGLGPQRTTLAQAMQDYGLERLPYLNGAEQEARRFNVYLRAAGLSTLAVRVLSREERANSEAELAQGQAESAPDRDGEVPDGAKRRKKDAQPKVKVCEVSLVPPQTARKIPRGLGEHRARGAARLATADAHRQRLACMPMAEVARWQVQSLMDALGDAQLSPASVGLERAMLRSLFNHAGKVWAWGVERDNPAAGLRLPAVDNARCRVMSEEEEARICAAFTRRAATSKRRNKLVAPAIALYTETAMRCSEPILHATWDRVDWNACTLTLGHGKTGTRQVPLSPGAIVVLRELQALVPSGPADPILPLRYDALKKEWERICELAGVEDLHLHDLRHTAATRFALKTGNVFLVQAFTGHKTLQMVQRYVNVTAADAVRVMHADAYPRAVVAAGVQTPHGDAQDCVLGENVVSFAAFRSQKRA